MTKDQLALRVQEIIAGVDGVAGLYPARSAVLAGLASTLGAAETLVAVDVEGPTGGAPSGGVPSGGVPSGGVPSGSAPIVRIRARIAALTDSSAPRLVREVATAIRSALAGEVQVSSVEITICGFASTPFP